MHPETVAKIAHVVAEQYLDCTPGSAWTFCQMVGLVGALFNLSWEKSIALTGAVFKKEFAAFQREFEHGEMKAVDLPHGGRWQLDFRPDLN